MKFDLDRSIPEVKFNIKPNRDKDQYKRLQLILESEINSMGLEHKILNLKERILFAEATHFISAPPFFLDNCYHNNLAEALYIQGVLLFNEFLDRYYINYGSKDE